ncbi:hypothetical protein F2P56_008112 [Juglans regia]|uniref:PAP/OAS1 substrate-binding-related domain-containing protein n=2 Tax=Juglans regia TaxID=51240 RepID=A0A834D6N5_JUGRE|nr:uncharacterized protein LOC108982152 isoform X2 [Juglans regia]KAF5476391.1 hypothetical protein F2P56_008112 [Juglans regia]
MGDTRDWLPEPNGAVLDQRPPSSSSSLFSSNQTVIGAVYWQRAEDATQGVIAQVQPTVVSENRRKAVIDYVQRLITSCLGCEVFPFGSVPLKTYLPDGDIDLTAFGGLNVEEALASDVFSVLEREDQNGAAEFIVKDVQLIRAEVDRKIGKDHLFKRSIILVKAWCYYESRILGAHHGLISTYALETLVLYIFHLFHASLNGPLAVLYKFLDYFSKFDWENYCISLNGPVRISSLPNLMAETPENDGSDLLLSSDFLKQCLEMFSVSSRSYEPNSRTFPPKHLNIVDPLKENNNLGRSVSKGNFYRIRSAFTYGARKLGRILSQPEVNIDDEIREFFSNTLDRHGSRQRPDVQDPVLASGHDMFGTTSLFSDTDSQEDQTIHESEHSYVNGMTGECRLGYEELMHGGLTNIKTSGASMSFGRALNEPKRSTTNASTSSIPDSDGSGNGITVSEHHLSGDAKDVAASRIQGLTISNDATKSPPSSRENGISPLDKAHHAPYGEGREGKEWPENSGYAENDFSGLQQAPHKEKPLITPCGLDDNQLVSDKHSLLSAGSKHQLSCLSSVAWSSEDLYPNRPAYRALNGTSGNPEALNSLSDLSGDYESHLNSLHNGRWCYEHASSASITPMSPLLVPQLHGKKPWDIIRQSVQLNRNVFSQMNANSVVPRSGFYRMNLPILPSGVVFGTEEMPKPRGTGTYFPNTNHYGDRPLTARGRNQAPVRSPRNNGGAILTPESNWSERSNHELAQAQLPVYGSGKSLPSYHTSGSPGRNVYSTANGSLHPSERAVEFGLIENLPVDGSLLERSGQKNYGSVLAQDSSGSLPLPGMQSPKAVVDMNQERIGVQSYRLKDEDDFPPLSV